MMFFAGDVVKMLKHHIMSNRESCNGCFFSLSVKLTRGVGVGGGVCVCAIFI